jgi:hypothetical protein
MDPGVPETICFVGELHWPPVERMLERTMETWSREGWRTFLICCGQGVERKHDTLPGTRLPNTPLEVPRTDDPEEAARAIHCCFQGEKLDAFERELDRLKREDSHRPGRGRSVPTP